MPKLDHRPLPHIWDPPKEAEQKHNPHLIPSLPHLDLKPPQSGESHFKLPPPDHSPFVHLGDDAKPLTSKPATAANKSAPDAAKAADAASLGAVGTGTKAAANPKLAGSAVSLRVAIEGDEDIERHPRDPKHDKEVKHAEEVRQKLTEQVATMKDVSPEHQKLILERTAGLSGDALIAEMKFFENALSSKNADRALNAYADLSKMVADDPKAAERLTPAMMGMLVTGVANPRTDSDRGQAGVLGGHQVRDAAATLLAMSQSDYDKLGSALGQAGKDEKGKPVAGADAAAEQALVLKALAARKDQLQDHQVGPDGKSKADLSMDEILGFATEIRGQERKELIRTTTALDIDDVNTSTVKPTDLTSDTPDDKADNDGLFQRFTTTCGPTTAQMVAAENDPIYARKLHKDGINNADPTSETSKQQQQVLEDHGGNAVSRLGNKAGTLAVAGLNAAEKAKTITHDQRMAVERYLYYGSNPKPEELAQMEETLEKIRAANGGHPTAAEVNAIRYNDQKASTSGVGMTLPPALNEIAGDAANTNYTGLGVNYKDMAARLKDGQTVPIRNESWGGHFMMVSDVRGDGAAQQFLVSDPWTGATRWMSADQMKTGKFDEVFGIPEGGITTMYGDKDYKPPQ